MVGYEINYDPAADQSPLIAVANALATMQDADPVKVAPVSAAIDSIPWRH